MSTILTHTGRYFDYTRPEDYDYPIEEIALALSRVPRFSGQTVIDPHTGGYHCASVAQHSVRVALLAGRRLALHGLMHDAHEAYVGDVPTPLKRLLPGYKEIEQRVAAALAAAHGIPELSDADAATIKAADSEALRIERRLHMPKAVEQHPDGFPRNWEPMQDGYRLHVWDAERACNVFLACYYNLLGEQ